MGLTQNLLNLYRVDAQVRGLRARLDSAKRYLDAQTRMLGELKQQAEELRSRRRQVQAKAGNLEGEMKGHDERIEKLRTELNSASTNKQYTAVLTELNTIKDARSAVETLAIEQLELSEEIGGEIKTADEQCAERSKVRTLAEDQLRKREEEVGERLTELESERSVAAAAVAGNELKVFNEMADCYDGEAMATVEEVSRRHREYACGECNMQLPFELVAALLGTGDTLVRCAACGRILYLEEETRGALAKK